jgi:hypothetical protein
MGIALLFLLALFSQTFRPPHLNRKHGKWPQLNEQTGWQRLLGGTLILGGVWIAQREEPRNVGEELADPDTPKGV